MRAFKKILALAAVLAIGALAFADEAASNYITKFTSLVTTAETCAKNNDGSKIAELEANKVQIDALRKTVTLSLTQRFSDWRLNQRYDSACQKIKAAQKSSTAAASAKDSANKIGAALNDAANQVGGALKETGTQAVNNVKESVNPYIVYSEASAERIIPSIFNNDPVSDPGTVNRRTVNRAQSIQQYPVGFSVLVLVIIQLIIAINLFGADAHIITAVVFRKTVSIDEFPALGRLGHIRHQRSVIHIEYFIALRDLGYFLTLNCHDSKSTVC